MKSVASAAAIAVLSMTSAWGQTGNKQPINIVAAENFYGDVAKQIGGANLKVTKPQGDQHSQQP
jgi:ABC-type Zn uptake system ZnuABC Zn-binding protein ZnuA